MGNAKRIALGALLFSVVLNPLSAIAVDEDSFECNIGPVTKTYGQAQWLVYSCNDDKTLVIVSAPGNPATPFYFTFLPTDASPVWRRHGQEGGNRCRLRTTQIAV